MNAQQPDRLPSFPELEAEYEIIRELGHGGTAVVYLARERALGRDVAIKLIRPTHVRDEDAAARLIREARTISKLQHPNIVMLLGVRRMSDGGLALILQYVPGRTLKELVREEGPLPFDLTEKILGDVARALVYAHRHRIVHRDIKPENVYLDDGCDVARLADFGIARPWDSDSGLTLPGTAIGTPSYMSPEQVDGKELDGRSDVYSLGLLGYEMLTGEQPWTGESLYSVIYKQKHEDLPAIEEARPDIPDRLRIALQGALQKRRERRWPSAEAFLEALIRGSPLPEPEDELLPEVWIPEDASEGEGRQVGSKGWAGALGDEDPDPGLEERSTLRYSASSSAPGSEPSRERPGWAIALLMMAVFLAAGLGVDALVSGSDGYAYALLSQLSSPEEDQEGIAANLLEERRDGASWAEEGIGGASLEPAPGDVADPEALPDRPTVEEDADVPPPPAPAEAIPGDEEVAEPAGAPERPPVRVEVVRGSDQTGAAGGVLPQPLEFRVLGGGGAPVAGAVVRFEVVTGGGRVEPISAVSDESGVARAFWTLGPEPGEQVTRATVATAPGLTTRFTARAALPRLSVRAGIAPGGTHSCLLRSDGSIACWGSGSPGRLGAAAELGPFTFLTSGMSHACALDGEGRAYCWGGNESGQLGSDGTAAGGEPGPVAGEARFSQVSAGASHTCGLTREGSILCWGANDSGQLGDGSRTQRGTPVRTAGGGSFTQVTAGWSHTCALDASGAAHCWGSNGSGELGIGGGGSATRPTPVNGGHSFSALAAGASHTCGVRRDGVLLCWGGNEHAQLGDGTSSNRSRPTPVAADLRFSQVAAGSVHTCALTEGGSAYCWGRNPYGQLGDGTTTDRSEPTPVAGELAFSSIHSFASHTCGRTTAGETLCWGYNVDGQLGDGTRENRHRPTPTNF
jgi:serine/threonine protein kinase/alpha-tubulin suppressor-like RCC1 family protein